jgi:hypothetical protein
VACGAIEQVRSRDALFRVQSLLKPIELGDSAELSQAPRGIASTESDSQEALPELNGSERTSPDSGRFINFQIQPLGLLLGAVASTPYTGALECDIRVTRAVSIGPFFQYLYAKNLSVTASNLQGNVTYTENANAFAVGPTILVGFNGDAMSTGWFLAGTVGYLNLNVSVTSDSGPNSAQASGVFGQLILGYHSFSQIGLNSSFGFGAAFYGASTSVGVDGGTVSPIAGVSPVLQLSLGWTI